MKAERKPAFAPAVLIAEPVPASPLPDKAVITIDLADGRRVSIDATAPASLVSTALKALR